MLNDATIIRLHYPEDAPQLVSPDHFAALAAATAMFAEITASSIGLESVRTFLCAAPRKGSLEFHLKVDLKFDISPSAVLKRLVPRSGKRLSTLADASAIGAFVWAAVFAPGGILEHFSSYTADTSVHADQVRKEAVQNLIAFKKPSRVDLTELTTAAARTGAIRVEIELPDEAATIIYDRHPVVKNYRPQFSDYSMWNATAAMHRAGTATREEVVKFSRAETSIYHVRLNDADFKAFWAACHTGVTVKNSVHREPRALILWPLDQKIPARRGFHTGSFLPATIKDLIAIPEGTDLEIGADTIVLVGQAAARTQK